MACLQHEDVWTLRAPGSLCDSAQPMGFANPALGQGKAVLDALRVLADPRISWLANDELVDVNGIPSSVLTLVDSP